MASLWSRQARKQGASRILRTDALTWRALLLKQSDQRSGAQAKEVAIASAHKLLEAVGAPRPKATLRHDTAEALLVGLWGIHTLGWLTYTQLTELQRAMK